MVGHEGKNSLLSELIKQDLATGLSSGERSRCQKNFSGFNISVSLTDKGVENKEEVMRLIFAFINQMRLNGGPPRYIADEKRQMKDIDF